MTGFVPRLLPFLGQYMNLHEDLVFGMVNVLQQNYRMEMRPSGHAFMFKPTVLKMAFLIPGIRGE